MGSDGLTGGRRRPRRGADNVHTDGRNRRENKISPYLLSSCLRQAAAKSSPKPQAFTVPSRLAPRYSLRKATSEGGSYERRWCGFRLQAEVLFVAERHVRIDARRPQ